jgi:hypothetical protein
MSTFKASFKATRVNKEFQIVQIVKGQERV